MQTGPPRAQALLDHRVGVGEESVRNSEAKGSSGLQVDRQLKRGWLFNRQIGGLAPTRDRPPALRDCN